MGGGIRSNYGACQKQLQRLLRVDGPGKIQKLRNLQSTPEEVAIKKDAFLRDDCD